MGCSSSDASQPNGRRGDDAGADELDISNAPHYGANELPPVPYVGEFASDNFIAWIIDDAISRTKPLPQWKKTVEPEKNKKWEWPEKENPLNETQNSGDASAHLEPSNPEVPNRD